MLRRGVFGALALSLLLALVAAGCGSKKTATTTTAPAATTTAKVVKVDSGPTAPCSPAQPAMSGTPVLPTGFPTPTGVVYVKQKPIGPSKATFAFSPSVLKSMYTAYKAALPPAGFKVTKAELDPADSEVNFAGKGTTGQVRLNWRCAQRTSITIIVRPK